MKRKIISNPINKHNFYKKTVNSVTKSREFLQIFYIFFVAISVKKVFNIQLKGDIGERTVKPTFR